MKTLNVPVAQKGSKVIEMNFMYLRIWLHDQISDYFIIVGFL